MLKEKAIQKKMIMSIITGSYQYLDEWLGGLGTSYFTSYAYHTLNSPVYSDSSLSSIDINGNR